MAAGGRKQINVLNTAVRKLAGRFDVDDPALIMDAVASLASQGVCARCLLRVTGHMGIDDYCLSAPSQSEILAMLTSSRSSSSAGASPEQPPEQPASQDAILPSAPTAAATMPSPPPPPSPQPPLCPACFGLLPALLDNPPPAPTANEAPANGNHTSGTPAGGEKPLHGTASPPPPRATDSAAPASSAPFGGATDLAWLRIQHKGLPGAVGCHTGPAAGHERLKGRPSVASLAAAVRHQAEEGPPETVALAAAAAAAAGDVVMAEADVGAEVEVQRMGPRLPIKSLSVEVGACPAATAVRDVAMHSCLVAACVARGVKCPAWRPTDVVALPTLLRKALPAALSRLLSAPPAAPQSASLQVSVAMLDCEEGLEEIRALIAAGRRPQYHHNPHQQHRFNKRQRGPTGQQQHADQESGDGGAQGKGPEERERPMSYEQASTAACSLPHHIFSRHFPWPPLTSAKRREQRQQQEQHHTYQQRKWEANGDAAVTDAEAAAPVTAAPEASAALPAVFVRAVHAPILLAGRYCKLRRHMPQCPWFVLATGARIGGISVQEAIERFVLPLYGTSTAKMITGGREDADVRMLGPGRPFILELQAPLRGHPPAAELRRLEQRMLASKCGVSVQGLSPCGPSSLESIKAAEEAKEKTYRALCWAEQAPAPEDLEALAALGRVEVMQDTPVRVLHRRAARVRPKWLQVESAAVVPGQPHYFVLQVRTQAGAYVKEFCHGDFGRCRPSLGDLLGRLQSERAGAAAVDASTAVAASSPKSGATPEDKNGSPLAEPTPSAEPSALAAPSPVVAPSPSPAATSPSVSPSTSPPPPADGKGTADGGPKRKFAPKPKPRPSAKPDATASAASASKPDPKSTPAVAAAEAAASSPRPVIDLSSDSGPFIRVEIVQLDVLDVHLENWP